MSYKERLKEELKVLNLPAIAYAVGVLILLSLLVFFVLLTESAKKAPEVFRPEPKYDRAELEAVETELKDKGFTRNIDPYYNFMRSKILTKKIFVIKYKLKKNDNLWTIKSRFKISMNTIVGANPYLKSLESTRLGQEILVLNRSGVLHRTKKEETPESIAALYGIAVSILTENNELASALREDQFLFLPSVEPVDLSKEMKELYALKKIFGFPFEKWHKRSSGMGFRTDPFTGAKSFHSGTDLPAKYGEKVFAVADGVVIFSGENGGYGNMIRIRHKDGYETLYGHNSKLLVSVGKKVNRGQAIALAGSTGRSTGTHLHFEVYKNGKLLDPKPYITQ